MLDHLQIYLPNTINVICTDPELQTLGYYKDGGQTYKQTERQTDKSNPAPSKHFI